MVDSSGNTADMLFESWGTGTGKPQAAIDMSDEFKNLASERGMHIGRPELYV
jgi:hypothetical protein